jgi:hypothetical protein
MIADQMDLSDTPEADPWAPLALALQSVLENRTVLARLLDALAKRTADPRFARAAGILRGKHAIRPARDDSAALAQIGDLLAHGTASSAEQAARFVARTLQSEHSVEGATERLVRKYRRLHSTATKDLSVET